MKLVNILSLIITVFGAAFGIFGIRLSIGHNIEFNLWLLFSNIAFLLLFLVFFTRAIKNGNYKRAYATINMAFKEINELNDDHPALKDLKDCIPLFTSFCTKISAGFKTITNKKCSVCIKLLEKEEETNEACAFTFVRDKGSLDDGRRINPMDEDDTIHYLKDNTDFIHIFENISESDDEYKYFVSNNLPNLDFYKNTRIVREHKYPPKINLPILKEIARQIKWPLPYRSTITVPIIPYTKGTSIVQGAIAGYLCVDTRRALSFNKKYDVEILRGIADGIYNSVSQVCVEHFESVHTSVKLPPKRKRK